MHRAARWQVTRSQQHDAQADTNAACVLLPQVARRQVVPCGPSSNAIPLADHSARIASARAKSRALRAASRSAIAASMAAASSVPPRNQLRDVLLQQAHHPARRAQPAGASKSPASARSASACIADSASGVFRSSHSASITGARHIDRGDVRIALQRAIEPVEFALRLGQRRVGEIRRRTIMRADQRKPHRLGRRLGQHLADGEEVAGLFAIFSPFTFSMPLCTQ